MQSTLRLTALSILMVAALGLISCGGSSSSSSTESNITHPTLDPDQGQDQESEPDPNSVNIRVASISPNKDLLASSSVILETWNIETLRTEHGTLTPYEPTDSAKTQSLNANSALSASSPQESKSTFSTISSTSSSNSSSNTSSTHSKVKYWTYQLNESYLDNRNLALDFVESFLVTDDSGQVSTMYLDLSPKDSLIKYQWHLYNNSKVATDLGCAVCQVPVKGFDLNILAAWRQKDPKGRNITGKGVKVAIVDFPVDYRHEDLKDNIFTPNFSLSNIDTNAINRDVTYNLLRNYYSLHGTKVAGIIGAAANNFGVRGEAYDAQMYSVNVVDRFVSDSSFTERDVYSYLLNNSETDVVNESYGGETIVNYDESTVLSLDALYEANIPVVKATGNGFSQKLYKLPFNVISASYKTCDKLSVNCDFGQIDAESSHPDTIAVAAADSRGQKASYSTTGSYIWVTGFGGGVGVENQDRKYSLPAIATTASHFNCEELPTTYVNGSSITGLLGYDTANGKWRTSIDPTCHYTATMNGTSAATPSVTGVIALLKQVNPNFTVPQIKYILAATARNDRDFSSLSYSEPKMSLSHGKFVSDQGWFTNGAGMRFSNYYGFGVVDAGAAVTLAQNCANDEECALRKDLPLIVVNASAPNCALKDATQGLYECTFTNLKIKDEDGKLHRFNGELEIEHTAINIFGLKLVHNTNSSAGFCAYNPSSKMSDAYPFDGSFYHYALSNIAINLSSPNTPNTILKAPLSNWLFDRQFYDDSVSPVYYISTNAFYQERVGRNGTWKLEIISPCELDVDSLNEVIELRLLSYLRK